MFSVINYLHGLKEQTSAILFAQQDIQKNTHFAINHGTDGSLMSSVQTALFVCCEETEIENSSLSISNK